VNTPIIDLDDQRLDKWLWCARFFKTRSLAQSAINAGHVSVDGTRAKPAKTIAPGMQLTIRRPPYEFVVAVRGLAPQRLSAPLAQALYEETAASIEARQTLLEQLRLAPSIDTDSDARFNKKARRQHAALQRQWDEIDD
jgi:ribosome-associated heat shock protein Hsp15